MCSVNTCKTVFETFKEADNERDLILLCFNLEKCEACAFKKQVEQHKKKTYEAVEAEYRRLYDIDRSLMIKAWSSV